MSTADAISPDSGLPWATEGAWPVADGVHRVPLPLPSDGLRAVNVYVIEADDGLTLVDGGWAIPEARARLERGLAHLGAGFGDVRRFLVTHVHRDHYTLASQVAGESGAVLALGVGDRPSIEALRSWDPTGPSPFDGLLRRCGAPGLADAWTAGRARDERPDLAHWREPDSWLDGDVPVEAGGTPGARVLDAVHTPGHTPGHYVFADRGAGLLMAGDHVLPTITPSIGFVVPAPPEPLARFLASLAKVRALPDLRLLPAHGPVADSTHDRVDELLAHHEDRLALCRTALAGGAGSCAEVAGELPWTRRERRWADLDPFNAGLAVLETRAHLDVLVARGEAAVDPDPAPADDDDGGDGDGDGDDVLRYRLT